MSAAAVVSLIPGLERVIQHGMRKKRAETLQRITALFIEGANCFGEDPISKDRRCAGNARQGSDRLMDGAETEPLLTPSKAVGLDWPTVRAIVSLQSGRNPSRKQVNETFGNFGCLSQSTAKRVVRFWQVCRPI